MLLSFFAEEAIKCSLYNALMYDVESLFRESIRLLELKFGSFYLVVMS